MALAGIDFVKNIMIAAQCYVGTLMEPASAKLLAYTLVAPPRHREPLRQPDLPAGQQHAAVAAGDLPHDCADDLHLRHPHGHDEAQEEVSADALGAGRWRCALLAGGIYNRRA